MTDNCRDVCAFILAYAAGLRPTPAQATVVSWILKDGMQHVGKLICSNLGACMDSEPKTDVLYDLGTGLEIFFPLCPPLFLETAGLGNFAKGMAVVAARATRLPIYSSFAKEGNLSDLFAKGEAISTVFNVLGLGADIQLVSTVCSSMQGKMVVGPILSIIHVYSVSQEMRAAPVNTLNPQRTAMIVEEFLKPVQPDTFLHPLTIGIMPLIDQPLHPLLTGPMLPIPESLFPSPDCKGI